MRRIRDFPGDVVIAQGAVLAGLGGRIGWLPEEERQRAARISRPDAARAFVARRALLRHTLGNALGLAPAQVRLTRGPRGKPELDHDGPPLWFNLSDTTGCAVVGLSRSGPVGVDVESAGRRVDHQALARRWFTRAEQARMAAAGTGSIRSDPAALEFLYLWTARESAAKLDGEGMARCLGHHEVVADLGQVTSNRDGSSEVVARVAVEEIDGYVIAVAWPPAIASDRLRTADGRCDSVFR